MREEKINNNPELTGKTTEDNLRDTLAQIVGDSSEAETWVKVVTLLARETGRKGMIVPLREGEKEVLRIVFADEERKDVLLTFRPLTGPKKEN